jgi:hypothetical protein
MMKKLFAGLMILIALTSMAPSAKAVDAGGAAIISAVLPGCGEWYNRGWKGGFPWAECVVGHICCLFQLSSVMDAVNGNTDEGLRLDFWSAPQH